MQRTARRVGLLTLVLLTFAATQADDGTTREALEAPGAFLDAVAAERRASSMLTTVVDAGTPAGLPASAAWMSSEAVRAQLWLPDAPPDVRTVVVREGQSVWDIASAWGVSVETIAVANGLANPEYVKPGQRLVIPTATDPGARATLAAQAAQAARAAATGPANARAAQGSASSTPRPAARARSTTPAAAPLMVTLREGQTIWSLARAHGISVEAVAEANGLADASQVRAGRRLVIPGRTADSAPGRVTTVRTAAGRADTIAKAASTAIRIARGFLWPARGQLTSRFGWRRWRHHDGIDIAAPYGSPIYAARPGRVVFAGWYAAYGRAVIIDHGDGLQTLYGHASKVLVRAGQTVGQGQLIARVGSSGRATGPHVHFEVRVNGRAINPLKYMN